MVEFDDGALQEAAEAFDAFYTKFGKRCKLIFESSETVCPNCVIDPSTGESTNRYLAGGPIPFINTICPVCEGKGRLTNTTPSKTIKMYLNWDLSTIRKWLPPIVLNTEIRNLRMPGGAVMGIGFIEDTLDVVQCDYCLMDIDSDMYSQNRYKLAGAPLDNRILIPHRYFTSFWERV
jgi:hypothetical protein